MRECRSSRLGMRTHVVEGAPAANRSTIISRMTRRATCRLSGGSPLQNPPGVPAASGLSMRCLQSTKGPVRMTTSGFCSATWSSKSSSGLYVKSVLQVKGPEAIIMDKVRSTNRHNNKVCKTWGCSTRISKKPYFPWGCNEQHAGVHE